MNTAFSFLVEQVQLYEELTLEQKADIHWNLDLSFDDLSRFGFYLWKLVDVGLFKGLLSAFESERYLLHIEVPISSETFYFRLPHCTAQVEVRYVCHSEQNSCHLPR